MLICHPHNPKYVTHLFADVALKISIPQDSKNVNKPPLPDENERQLVDSVTSDSCSACISGQIFDGLGLL